MDGRAVQAALNDVAYKPGWAFVLVEDDYEGLILIIHVKTTDANSGNATELRISSHVPPAAYPRDFYRWLLWRILRIESHEAREFFRVDGHRFADPGHAP